jgi:PIN domain nuclease of toxin-antitoxin system
MRVLLDTAVFIFAVEAPNRLSKRAYAMLRNPATIRETSSISLTEIAIKTDPGKLNISAEMARQAMRDMDIRILPFSADHAFRAFELAPYHRDPFDRQIIAQALVEGITIVTPDEQFKKYKEVRTLW